VIKPGCYAAIGTAPNLAALYCNLPRTATWIRLLDKGATCSANNDLNWTLKPSRRATYLHSQRLTTTSMLRKQFRPHNILEWYRAYPILSLHDHPGSIPGAPYKVHIWDYQLTSFTSPMRLTVVAAVLVLFAQSTSVFCRPASGRISAREANSVSGKRQEDTTPGKFHLTPLRARHADSRPIAQVFPSLARVIIAFIRTLGI